MVRIRRMVSVAVLALLLTALPTPGAAQSVPVVAPSPPQNVQVEATDDGALVTWDAPLFDGGSSDLTYRVYRDGALVADDLVDLEYLDLGIGSSSGMAATASYTYTVTAVNEAGESYHGPTGCIDIQVPIPTVDPVGCALFVVGAVFWVIDQILWVIGNITP